MKRVRMISVAIGCGIFTAGVAALAFYLGSRYLAATAHAQHLPVPVNCNHRGVHHQAVILNNNVEPRNTRAALCDTLTITNEDKVIRLMAFGPHDHHQPYDGITEKVLSQSQELTITLNQAGLYQYHDHLDIRVSGEFLVVR
jgi:hypothetical protein